MNSISRAEPLATVTRLRWFRENMLATPRLYLLCEFPEPPAVSDLVRFCSSTSARQSGWESPAAGFPNSAPGDDTWAGQGAAPTLLLHPAKGPAGRASPEAPSSPGPTTPQPGTLHCSNTAGARHPVAPRSQAPHLGKGRTQGSPAPPASPTWQAPLPARGKSRGHLGSLRGILRF